MKKRSARTLRPTKRVMNPQRMAAGESQRWMWRGLAAAVVALAAVNG